MADTSSRVDGRLREVERERDSLKATTRLSQIEFQGCEPYLCNKGQITKHLNMGSRSEPHGPGLRFTYPPQVVDIQNAGKRYG